MQVMRDTLRIGLAYPVLGVGYGRGKLKAAIRASTESESEPNEPIWHAHNVYLQLFAGSGFAGLGAFVWLLGSALNRTLRAARVVNGDDRILTLGLAASAVALMVCGLSDVTFHHHETRLFCFTLLALMLRASNEKQKMC
jgi:O-antigen ligase